MNSRARRVNADDARVQRTRADTDTDTDQALTCTSSAQDRDSPV